MAYIHGNISAGTTKGTLGELVFSNSNGISFGINGQTITGTVQTNYLTTAMASNRGTDFVQATAAFAGTSASGTIASNGISVSIGPYITTGALSNHSHGVSFTSGSVGFQTLSFTNSNGISFNSGTQGIFGSHNAITTGALSGDTTKYNQAWELTGNTAGTTSSLQGTKMYFEGGNSITVSGNSNTIKFSVGNYITTAMLSNAATISNINVSGGTTSSNLSAFKFVDSQGVSWSLDTGSKVYATVKTDYQSSNANYLTSQSNQAVSNSAGSFTFQTLNFSNANNVTFGTSAGGIVTASVAAPGAAAENNWHNLLGANTAGNTTASGSTIGLSGINLTLSGTNDSVINISAPATSSIVGTNGLSVSTNASTIYVYPITQSSYANLPGLFNSSALTFNQTSISYAVAFNLDYPISASFIRIPALMTTNSTTIATMASATASAQGALHSTINAVFYSLGVGANSQSLQSVASGSAGYTMSQKISVTNSTQYSISLGISAQANGAGTSRSTQYSISNSNYSFTTNQIATEFSTGRFLDIPFAQSLSGGNYWLVLGMSTSTSSAGAAGLAALTNCNVRYSNHYGASQANVGFGLMGSTNLSSGGQIGAGFFSTAGGGTTNSIPISAISSTASNPTLYFQLLRSA